MGGPHQRELRVPHEIDEILERLPPQVTLNVPAQVLIAWFALKPGDDSVDEMVLDRARSFAQSCGCRFAYHASIREGIFFRPAAGRN
jgi:hypothetical protein